MSKSVSILEGDKGRRFSGVKYLRTTLQNNEVCEWVPEDERKLTTKHITKNGTYKAADEKDSNKKAYYGFSEVTVNVSGKSKGRKNPATGGDGKKYKIDTDEEGRIVETELPEYIKIVKEPTTVNYVDGQDISIDGIKVKAYYKDGGEWGDVPFDELSFEPTVAQAGDNTVTVKWTHPDDDEELTDTFDITVTPSN